MAGPSLETLPLVMAVGGSVLLYSAVTNRNPADVVKLALQGKSLDGAAPISGAPVSGTTPGQEGPVGPDRDPREPGTQNYLAPGPGGLGGPTPMPPGGLPFGTASYQPGQSAFPLVNGYLGNGAV